MRILLALLLPMLIPAVAADTTEATGDTIRHIRPDSNKDVRNLYYLDALRLALEHTRRDFGDYRLVPVDQNLSQSRAIALLGEGRTLDVLWTMTSRGREQQLRPIRVPLLRGLMGMRLLIIRAEDQGWFDNVTKLDQLRQLRAGQGHDWPDTEILRANDLPLVSVSNYEALFRMLKEGRFDYMPRAVNEPWEEVEAHPDMDLAVEDSLLLYYPAASYFFVAPHDDRLARRLQLGLERALEDGSLTALFRQHPVNRKAFEKAALLTRRVLRLRNPLLPKETPLDRPELWWLPPEPLEQQAAPAASLVSPDPP
jgi:hypothetical protein